MQVQGPLLTLCELFVDTTTADAALIHLLQNGHALFELARVKLTHVDHLLVELGEFNFLEPCVVGDYLINELLKVIVILLEQLDRLNLPHLFNLYVVELRFFTLDRPSAILDPSRRLFGLDPPLEHYDEEFATISLRYLNKELSSIDLLALDQENLTSVWYTEGFGLHARQHLVLRPNVRAVRYLSVATLDLRD